MNDARDPMFWIPRRAAIARELVMAEPTIVHDANEGTEGTPSWVLIDTGLRWVGPATTDGNFDFFAAPVLDGDDAFFDNQAAPNDGELWSEHPGTDVHVTVAGRQLNQNMLRMRESGGSDPTADPPEFTAYDDATDGANRTAPTVWLLTGTAGTSSISTYRAAETTGGAPGAAWGTQVHDAAPGVGNELDGDKTGEKVVTAAVLAASGNKLLAVAACAPHDSTPGETAAVYQTQYTYT